ncbi:unnamed protein product, partial [Ectocarpus fasciculatus]
AQEKSDNRRVASKSFRSTEASLNLPKSGASVRSRPRNGSDGDGGIGVGSGVAAKKAGGGTEGNSSAGEQREPVRGAVAGDSSKSVVESDGGDGEERASPREERGASDQSATGSLEGAGKRGGGEGEAGAAAAVAGQGGEDPDAMPPKPSRGSRSNPGGSGYNSNSNGGGGGADELAKISTRTRNKTAAKAAAIAVAARAAEEATAAATPKSAIPSTMSPLLPSAGPPLSAGKGADDGDSGTGTNRVTAASAAGAAAAAAGEAGTGQVSSLDGGAPIASTPAVGKKSNKTSAGSCVVKSEHGANVAARSEGSTSRRDETFEVRGWEQLSSVAVNPAPPGSYNSGSWRGRQRWWWRWRRHVCCRCCRRYF